METEPVSFTVLGVELVHGRGRLIGMASCEIDVAGVVLTLQGIKVVRTPSGGTEVRSPVFRHPRTGALIPAILIPPELATALTQEVWDQFRHALASPRVASAGM